MSAVEMHANYLDCIGFIWLRIVTGGGDGNQLSGSIKSEKCDYISNYQLITDSDLWVKLSQRRRKRQLCNDNEMQGLVALSVDADKENKCVKRGVFITSNIFVRIVQMLLSAMFWQL